jgi:hypothetical protein
VDSVALADLMQLAVNERAPEQVRALAMSELESLRKWLEHAAAGDYEQEAHFSYAAQQIALFEREPKKFVTTAPAEPPDGPPIGDDEEF